MHKAEIICVGSELLAGKTNTHVSYIAPRLIRAGFSVGRETTVVDSLEELRDALSSAVKRADFVLVSGGLGPTFDDLTREAASAALGLTLSFQPALYEKIRQKFLRHRLTVPASNKRQAWVLAGAKIMDNRRGSAPGQIVHLRRGGRRSVILLPGPFHELKPMFEERVLPELRKHFGKGPVSVQRTFKFYGLAESAADRKLRPVYAAAGRKADCTILAGLGLVELRVSLRADSASSGKRALEKIERRVRTAMKEHMYGTDEDTLASALGNRLKKLGRTIAVAESCTGGMLGEQITEVAGSSAYFLGGVLAYCNRVKLRQLCVSPETLNVHGAVSAPCARELAVNAAGLLGADCALSITGIAGPGGGSEAKPVGTVFIGIFIKNRHSGRATSCVKELRCAGTRAQIRQRAVHAAMFQMLRRLPIIRNKKHR